MKDDYELRFRSFILDNEENRYKMSVKIGTGLVRDEYEMDIPKEKYQQFVSNLPTITCLWYTDPDETKRIDIKLLPIGKQKLCILEKEFPDEESAMSFKLDDKYGTVLKEVTEDKRYNLFNLYQKFIKVDKNYIKSFNLYQKSLINNKR